MHLKGERWLTKDRREVLITWDLPNGFLRVMNEKGKLELIHESLLDERLADGVA